MHGIIKTFLFLKRIQLDVQTGVDDKKKNNNKKKTRVVVTFKRRGYFVTYYFITSIRTKFVSDQHVP